MMTVPCAWCGEPFPARALTARFCKAGCRRADEISRKRGGNIPSGDAMDLDRAFENVGFMLDNNEHPQRIAKRVGMNYATLQKRLRDHRQDALADRLIAVTLRETDEMRAYWDPNKRVAS